MGDMAVYAPVFCHMMLLENPEVSSAVNLTIADVFPWMLPFHFLGMAQNLVALILTMRDVDRRPFPSANDKVTWTLLILCAGGIGWVVYVFRDALKPRPTVAMA